ncbi:MAG: hypothetical protein ACTIJA_07355, partial [Bavariicoccus seileri]|uniref:hypothetical protein n=1 Tax=Bavariicoccus seileri TaxID=549685 RepID=UPI003F96844A
SSTTIISSGNICLTTLDIIIALLTIDNLPVFISASLIRPNCATDISLKIKHVGIIDLVEATTP